MDSVLQTCVHHCKVTGRCPTPGTSEFFCVGRLRVVADRCSWYRCYFVNPLRSALLLYVPMPLMRLLLCFVRL